MLILEVKDLKLEVGQKMPDFIIDTIFEKGVSLKEKVGDKKTALVFLRYEGCTVSRYIMRILKMEYGKIRKTGGQIMVVLQSDPSKLAKEIKRDDFPYDIICDPKQLMYKHLEIEPAKSVDELIGGKTKDILEKLTDTDIKHGDYEGDELQLTAAFVIDKNLTVLYAHYAKEAADLPDVNELAELLS
jgi:peroxiredoxin